MNEQRRNDEIYQVSQTNLYQSPTTFTAQPLRYFMVLLLFQSAMVIYFVVTTSTSEVGLIVATSLLYVVVTVIHLFFPFVDPGIIPKILIKYQETKKKEIPFQNQRFIEIIERGYLVDREYSFPISGYSVCTRFCNQCLIYRPPRSAHCYTCNICVQKLDHHCPWLGSCVGKRNYRFYLLYILSNSAIFILVMIQTILYITRKSFEANMVGFCFNTFLLALVIPALLFVVMLVGLHLKLSSKNETTNEYCHEKWHIISGNPYNKLNCLKNIIKACFKVYSSKNQLHIQVFKRGLQTTTQNIASQNLSDSLAFDNKVQIPIQMVTLPYAQINLKIDDVFITK